MTMINQLSKDPKTREKAATIDPVSKGRLFSQSGILVGESSAPKVIRPSTSSN